MQISKKLDSLRTCLCVVEKLSNVHEKYPKKETCKLKSNKNHKFSFIKYTAMFIPFKENEPHPQQLPPLFSDLKITPSLATYAVCTLCISQFHQRAAPSPPGYSEAFVRLVSPGGGAFANFALPGGRAFANPGAIPELLTRTRFSIKI